MPIFRLTDDLVFPPPSFAEPEGLLAVGGDLSPERLLLAYRSGIFPWFSEGEPLLWWSPDPRFVLYPGEYHRSRRLRRTLRQGRFELRADTAFDEVIAACATTRGPNRTSTWITPRMVEAYSELHRQGYAHSCEAWQGGRLAGGLYGVSIGACFFGESMFADVSDASKAAFDALVQFARENRFAFIDCQMPTEHLRRLGARDVPRPRFLDELADAVSARTLRGPWRLA